MSLEQFQTVYSSDPFYNWLGLHSPLMYTAHKAAGGMTSIYRQLGIGCERLFRSIIQDSLGLSETEATWSYHVPTQQGKTRTLSLDGRIDVNHIRDLEAKERVLQWLSLVHAILQIDTQTSERLKGAVFEIRQGYKSKDSKRQNADVFNASNAYAHSYIPVILILSTQIDEGVALRYRQARWLLLTGITEGDTITSTYAFCKDVLGFDLAGFFVKNSQRLKYELEQVLSTLLQT